MTWTARAQKTCEQCRNPFWPRSSGQRVCHNPCVTPQSRKLIARACAHCGKQAMLRPEKKYCDMVCMALAFTRVREKRRCEGCQNLFTPDADERRFCSHFCWTEQRKKETLARDGDPKIGTCFGCGNEFKRPDRRWDYCEKCRVHRLTMKKQCVVCGATYRPAYKTQKCCGAECKALILAKRERVNCKICGRPCRKRGFKFCGDACYRQHQQAEALRRRPKCEVCGNPVKGTGHTTKSRSGIVKRRRFCGFECMGISNRKYSNDEERKEAKRAQSLAYARKAATVEYHVQRPTKGERQWLRRNQAELRNLNRKLSRKPTNNRRPPEASP